MRKAFKKILFEDQPVKQYLTVSIDKDVVTECAFLWLDDQEKVNVSNEQFVLCQRPFIIGIWIGKNNEPSNGEVRLDLVGNSGNLLLWMKLKKIRVVEFPEGKFILFSIVHTRYFFINFFHQKALMLFFFTRKGNKIQIKELNCFCAAYAYPRKVILTCFGQDGYYNLFPMDFQGLIQDAQLFVLGLRNTNITLNKILESKRVVVCEIAASEKELILMLGRHHSSMPPDLTNLSFPVEMTSLYNIPIPKMAKSYRELEIVYSSNEGSHTIMVGKIINHSQASSKFSSLFHWHITSAMRSSSGYAPV
jgi:flavin reductase (DIM6/NTAB) family NADH-FMN oxidoreductase RutF